MNPGFLASLFDFSFSTLITPRIIKVVYVLITILTALFSLYVFAALATLGGGGALLGLIVGPLVFLIYMILSRISLEMVIIVFRIGDDVQRIADRQAPAAGGPRI
jgi:hypothetical protein